MNPNKETHKPKHVQFSFDPAHKLESRLDDDRRTEPSKGFTYISSVGWIDRREKLRRKDDRFDF